MIDFSFLRSLSPYSLKKIEKNSLFVPLLYQLNEIHEQKCQEFRVIARSVIRVMNVGKSVQSDLENAPFVPIRLFKTLALKSSEENNILEMNSSGTTMTRKSRIFVDSKTSTRQSIALGKIIEDFIGESRLPLLILDSEDILKNRSEISARAAGILGFSRFAEKRVFALDDDLSLDLNKVMGFLLENKDRKTLVFGFSSIVWEKVLKELLAKDIFLPPNKGILFHGGGWKRLTEKTRISKDDFKQMSKKCLGVSQVHDYYGMAEQTGSIFVECEYGYFHCSIFSEVIIRDFVTLVPLGFGEEGLIQVISLLPTSYPGHSILTEDVGLIIGEDDCGCGRYGKYFSVKGRVPRSEIRGCSDATNL